MKFGYARVSSRDQNLDRQIVALKKAGSEKIFAEKISGKNTNRPQLQELLNTIHMKDEVIVQDVDRLGRNAKDITKIMDIIKNKGATFSVLNLPSFKGVEDDNLRTLLNSLVIDIFKYVAEAERMKIKERQVQGVSLAKQRGVYKGRPRTYSPDSRNPKNRYLYNKIIELIKHGHTDSEISRQVGVSRTTIMRIRREKINETS